MMRRPLLLLSSKSTAAKATRRTASSAVYVHPASSISIHAEPAKPIRSGNAPSDSVAVAATIDDAGSRLLLTPDRKTDSTTDETELTFSAQWLWVNDPKHIHPTSGQRLKTPGDYPGTKLCRTSVMEALENNVEPSVPPRGSCHSRGGVYQNTNKITTNEVKSSNQETVRLEWQDGQESFFPLSWLRDWGQDRRTSASSRDRQTEITPDLAIGAHRDIPTHRYDDAIGSEEESFPFLKDLFEHGAVLLQGAPARNSFTNTYDDGTGNDDANNFDSRKNNSASLQPSVRVANAIAGGTSHGQLYGDVFHVRSVQDAHNVAYTTLPLAPHQDLVYFESKPGLQILHCHHNYGVSGGQSTLVDAMAAAHALRDHAPDLFAALARYPATFCKQRGGADMVYRRPHIAVSYRGGVHNMTQSGCGGNDSSAGSSSTNHQEEIVGINWAPQFEGPLMLSNDSMQDYYKAYAVFERMIDNSKPEWSNGIDDKENANHDGHNDEYAAIMEFARDYAHTYTWERTLQEGEVLVFNNQRMLHGRRGFEFRGEAAIEMGRQTTTKTATPGRHLIGCYADIDDALNRYRVLVRDRTEDVIIRNVGNGTVGTQI